MIIIIIKIWNFTFYFILYIIDFLEKDQNNNKMELKVPHQTCDPCRMFCSLLMHCFIIDFWIKIKISEKKKITTVMMNLLFVYLNSSYSLLLLIKKNFKGAPIFCVTEVFVNWRYTVYSRFVPFDFVNLSFRDRITIKWISQKKNFMKREKMKSVKLTLEYDDTSKL